MVILVVEEVEGEAGFRIRFLRVEAEESESESASEPEVDPVPAEETLEATEDTLERSTWM